MGRLGSYELDTIVCDDCLDVMAQMPDNCIDTIITDPPYGLKFMGKAWDHGVPGVPYWKAALRVAKPGAFLLAFGGTRTHHRLMCAIEDAGWEIRDCMMYLYGSGFPKSHDIGKAIDRVAPRRGMFDAFARDFMECRKAAQLSQKDIAAHFPSKTGGLTGCVWNWENGANVPTRQQWETLQPLLGLSDKWLPLIDRIEANRQVTGRSDRGAGETNWFTTAGDFDITAPATEAACLWDGWGTGLKPSWEPIIVAMKPREGTFAENALKWGVAGLWIDGGRIGNELVQTHNSAFYRALGVRRPWHDRPLPDDPAPRRGRFPANLILSHSEGCRQVGTKRVKDRSKGATRGGGSLFGADGTLEPIGYADPDGLETVADWECVEGCAVAQLNATPVDNFVFLCYNTEKREVNQCCEHASIAVVNLVLDHLMPSGGLGVSVAGNVVTPTGASGARSMLGGSKTSEARNAVVGTGGGANQEAESCISSLRADGSGKWQMGQSQRDMTSITLTEIHRTTICPICNSWLRLSITLCTSEDEKITALNQTEENRGAANGAKSTSPSQSITSVRREHITAIVKIANESTRESGARDIQHTAATISGGGGGKNVSRFFYTAKAARNERWFYCQDCQEAFPRKVRDDHGHGHVDEKGKQTWDHITQHPTQKPLAIMEYLCKLTMTPTGGIVFDPFAGSGSTLVAARRLGRPYLGCDISKEYVAMANKRLAQAIQLPLLPG